MFIDKARQLELSQAIGGIVIDHNTSLKSSNGAIFSMTGDEFNNIHIPLVLMFKDEAFHLLHLLSKYPNLIVYIGEEKFFKETFYQKIEILESFIEPFNQTSQKWIYGERNIFEKKQHFCPILSKKLKEFELAFQHIEFENLNKQPIIQFEHVIEADGNKSVEEITSQLFTSLNLTAINFGGQLNNIEAYRLALDKIVRTALTSANQSNLSNTQQESIEIPVEIITSFEEQTSTTTTTTDTREYTEKRSETKTKD